MPVAACLVQAVGRARQAPTFRRRRGRGDRTCLRTTTHAGTRPIGDVVRVPGIGSMVPPAAAPERRRLAGSADGLHQAGRYGHAPRRRGDIRARGTQPHAASVHLPQPAPPSTTAHVFGRARVLCPPARAQGVPRCFADDGVAMPPGSPHTIGLRTSARWETDRYALSPGGRAQDPRPTEDHHRGEREYGHTTRPNPSGVVNANTGT
jgi:hypothetical protein